MKKENKSDETATEMSMPEGEFDRMMRQAFEIPAKPAQEPVKSSGKRSPKKG